MKRFLCIALVLILAATVLTGCGARQKLLGTWETALDFSPLVAEALNARELGADLPISDFMVTAQLTFLKDGSFRMELEKQKLQSAFDALLAQLEQGLLSLIENQLKEEGLALSVADLLSMSDLTKEDLTEQLRQSFAQINFQQTLEEQVALTGYYKLSGKKLFLYDDPEGETDRFYMTCSLEGGVLTLSESAGESPLTEHLVLKTLPLTFTKAS